MNTTVHYAHESDPRRITYTASLDTTIECPICKNKNSFEFMGNGIGEGDEIHYLVMCQNCKKFFMATYLNVQKTDTYATKQIFSSIYPHGIFQHSFPHDIKQISEKFVNIYEQAMTAKDAELNELVGIGLRRAFEFLLSDYIKNVLEVEPAKTLEKRIEQIKVQNVNVNGTLVRWIGNDHTHIEIKHPEFSIEEMIDSINMVVYYLYAEYKSKEVAKKINNLQSRQ